MSIDKNELIFDNKSLSDLFSDIYNNSKRKQKKIDNLIETVGKLLVGVNDVAIILPMLKEILEVGVKNDEQLIKLAGVIQRLLTGSTAASNTSELLTEDEKKYLLKSANADKTLISENEGIDIDNRIAKLEEQVKKAKAEVTKGDKKLLGELSVKTI